MAAEKKYKFEGWLGHNADSVHGNMVWGEFEPKPWEENDVDIEITHSGVCGTDIHTLRSGWGPVDYPICVGHEIVGRIVRVGSQAEGGLSIGDRVGVGAQSDACLSRFGPCEDCSTGEEQYCPKFVATYAAHHFNGAKSMGGHGKYHRCPSHFAIKIPDNVRSEDAAPMLCGGVTLYSPLRYWNCGPGKSVGIIGIGGLGHFGILFAKAMGVDRVVGISRRESKRTEVIQMGADEYIATSDSDDWAARYDRSLDLLISTVSSAQMPMGDYLKLLKKDGAFVQVGNPDDGDMSVQAASVISRRIRFTGSTIGSPQQIRDMLALAAEKDLKFWVETRPMAEANEAIIDMAGGKARYRYVLVNEEA
ncbi:zinc-binding dehydrogenase [Sarocladium strictum]